MSFPPQGTKADVSDIPTTNPKVRDFWSDNDARITIAGAAADLDFPSVTTTDLSGASSVDFVVGMLKYRAINDTSGSDNYIDASGKSIRAMTATGSWGTDDIVAINMDVSQCYVVASTKEGGDLQIGDNDLSSIVTGSATFDFRSEQTNRSDAISALADNIELYDIQTGLRVWYTE